MIWLLVGYMWLFIHRPFEVWPWLGEYRIERVYMIATLLYWAIFAEKTWTSNRLNLAFLCLGISILLSALCSPFDPGINPTVENWLKFVVFYILVVSTVRTEEQLRFVVVAFIAIMALYIGHSFREFLCGKGLFSMGVKRMIGVDITMGAPNSFGPTILYSLPMIYPLWYEAQKRWQKLLLIGYVLLAGSCILLTGSRTSFVGMLSLSFLALAFSKHRYAFAIGLIIAVPLVWAVMREDLQNRYMTLVDPSYGPASAQASARGREKGFWDGMRNWQEHPVTGVGPGCNGLAVGHRMQAHNLYGQLLGELGTLGGLSFLFVVICFTSNTMELRSLLLAGSAPNAFSARVITSVFITVILLLLLGWGGHNLFRYIWLWYGAFQAIALNCVKQQATLGSIWRNEDTVEPHFSPHLSP